MTRHLTHRQHALQSAMVAEADGADDELVSAALLHDLGHLGQDLGETPQGAVRLRLRDEVAKSPSMATPPLAHYIARARRCALC